jgi:hypothetical protein
MRQSASIIDTLSEGYRAIHRRPAALLLVFVFNLALLITAPGLICAAFQSLR